MLDESDTLLHYPINKTCLFGHRIMNLSALLLYIRKLLEYDSTIRRDKIKLLILEGSKRSINFSEVLYNFI